MAWARIYLKFVLFCSAMGLTAPFVSIVLRYLSAEDRNYFERQLLLAQVKRLRTPFFFGPQWLRLRLENLRQSIRRYRIWFNLLLKFTVGMLIATFPLFLFVLTRGILPVTSRVPKDIINAKLPESTNIGIAYPFREVMIRTPFSNEIAESQTKFIPTSDVRGEWMSGYILKANELIKFKTSQELIPHNIKTYTRLRLRLTSAHTLQEREDCQIKVKDEGGLLLGDIPLKSNVNEKRASRILKLMKQRLVPNTERSANKVVDASIELDVLPKEFTIEHDENSSSACQTMISFPELEYRTENANPLPRAMILVLMDSFQDPAFDNHPRLTFLKELEPTATKFKNYFTPAVNAKWNVLSLLSGLPGPFVPFLENEKIVRNFDELKTLPQLAQRLGMKTVSIGRLDFLEEGNLQRFGIHFYENIDYANFDYDTRLVTEEALSWMQRNGDSPFLMVLRYSTLNRPFHPPYEFIRLSKLSESPFGRKSEIELYKGESRFLDSEIRYFLRKLKSMGIYSNSIVSIFPTSGIQLDKISLHGLNQKEPLIGSFVSSSDTFFSEDVKFPAWVHSPKQEQAREEEGDVTTDELFHILQKSLLQPNTSFESTLRNTNLAQDAQAFVSDSGVAIRPISSDASVNRWIYSRQPNRSHRARLFLPKWPYIERIFSTWNEVVYDDAYRNVFFNVRDVEEVKKLQALESGALKAEGVEFRFSSAKQIDWEFTFEKLSNEYFVFPASLVSVNGVKTNVIENERKVVLKLQGTVAAQEKLKLLFPSSLLTSFETKSSITFKACQSMVTTSSTDLKNILRKYPCYTNILDFSRKETDIASTGDVFVRKFMYPWELD